MLMADMVEPTTVPEFFVNGIARIDDVCGNMRFMLFSYEGAPLLRVAKVGIIAPTYCVPRMAMMAAAAAQENAFDLIH